MEDYANLMNALQESSMVSNINMNNLDELKQMKQEKIQGVEGSLEPIGGMLGIEGLKTAGTAIAKSVAKSALTKIAGVTDEQASAIVGGDLGAIKNAAINFVAKKAGIELPENASLTDIGNAVKSFAVKQIGQKAGLELTGNETPEELLNVAKTQAIKMVGQKAGVELTGSESAEDAVNILKTTALKQVAQKAGVELTGNESPEEIVGILSKAAPEALARAGITLPASTAGASSESAIVDASTAIRSTVTTQINSVTGLALDGTEQTAEDFANAVGKLALKTLSEKVGVALPENLELSSEGIINAVKGLVASKISSITGLKINPAGDVDQIGSDLLEQGQQIVAKAAGNVAAKALAAAPKVGTPAPAPAPEAPAPAVEAPAPAPAPTPVAADPEVIADPIGAGVVRMAGTSVEEFQPVLAANRLAPISQGLQDSEDFQAQAAKLLSTPSESEAIAPATSETVAPATEGIAPTTEAFEMTTMNTGEGVAAATGTATGEGLAASGEGLAATAGEGLAATAGVTIGETVGEVAGLGIMDALGPIGILATIGTFLYSVGNLFTHHDAPPPLAVLNPSVQFGT